MLLHHWTLRIAIYSMSIFLSCGTNQSRKNTDSKKSLKAESQYDNCDKIDKSHLFTDTVFVKTADDLKSQLKSNRVLVLGNKNYKLDSTLHLDGIKNLKIIGAKTTKLMLSEQNSTVLKLSNAQNFWIENVVIGHATNQVHNGESGTVRLEYSSNIHMANCKILGARTIGLITKEVCMLKINNSEFTKCSILLFELDRSQKIEITNTKFQNNKLAASVLGGFTNSTKDVVFMNCEFVNNQPEMSGNPAFNFYENYQNFEEKITFKDCTFEKNIGYKWYGDKIKLDNCKIDSTDFIGLK